MTVYGVSSLTLPRSSPFVMRRNISVHVVRAALIGVGILPFLPRVLEGFPRTAPLLSLIARWFRFQCHGRLDRTLVLAGQHLPICSRCTGIYLGLGLAAAIARPRLEARGRRIWIVAAAVAMVSDVVLQDLTGHAPWHAVRLATGLLLAWPVALTVLDAVSAR